MKKEQTPVMMTPQMLQESVEKAFLKGQSAEDWLVGNMQENSVTEKIIKEIVDRLFDKKNLLMVMRTSEDIAYYILRHLIIKGFYTDYYYKTKYFCVIVPKKSPIKGKLLEKWKRSVLHLRVECDCYDKICWYELPSWETAMEAHKEFIEQFQQITISIDGQGRKELIDMIRSFTDRRREDERKGGLTKWLGLTK